MIERNAYPMYTHNNNTPTNKSLFVSQIHYHVCSPGEVTSSQCIPNLFIIGYVVSGKLDFCGKILTPGDGYLINPESENYILRSLTNDDSFVHINISGYTVRKFLTNCSIQFHTHTFSYPFCLQIANILKNAAISNYENQDIDFVLTSVLYNIMSFHKQPILFQKKIIKPAYSPLKANIPYLQVILKYIEDNYQNPISVKQLADMVHLTPNYLSGMFKKTYNVSLQKYIIKYRIAIATDLLTNSTLSVGTIAEMVGYPDAQHFSQVFKSISGYTPSKYRELTKT